METEVWSVIILAANDMCDFCCSVVCLPWVGFLSWRGIYCKRKKACEETFLLPPWTAGILAMQERLLGKHLPSIDRR